MLGRCRLDKILHGYDIPKLNSVMKEKIENNISREEILTSLKGMKNNKSPGSDGFTAEFFKFLLVRFIISQFIEKSFQYCFKKGMLSNVQSQGIISILPKGNKPREFLKNWRPIALLNVSYKLLSTVLANRLKSLLNTLIHENQKGFLAGRYIGENTKLLYDLIHCNEKCKPRLVLLIDFEKAFDPVSWNFILKVVRFFLILEITSLNGIKYFFVVQGYVSFNMVFSQNFFQ